MSRLKDLIIEEEQELPEGHDLVVTDELVEESLTDEQVLDLDNTTLSEEGEDNDKI